MTVELTKEEISFIREEGYRDPVYFLRTHFDHLFPDTIPWVHRGIIAIVLKRTDFLLKYGELDKICSNFLYKNTSGEVKPMFTLRKNEQGEVEAVDLVAERMVSIIMPRGFSKTTLLLGIVLWLIYYNEREHIVLVSETGPAAAVQLLNVKNEIESNVTLRLCFGVIHPGRQDSEKWGEKMLQTLTGVIISSRGRGMQIRGTNFGGVRPDLILLDDVEDEDSVSSDTQRAKVKHWFYGTVKPALPRRGDKGSIIVLGTLLSSQALLAQFEESNEFTSVRFGAVDKQGDPLWPQHMNLEAIEKEKRAFAEAGELETFYLEYMSEIRAEGVSRFRSEFFTYKPFDKDKHVATALVIDPAISDKAEADYCAFAVVSMLNDGQLCIRECLGKKGMTPREQVDLYFQLSKEYNVHPHLHGVEAIAYQKALVHLLKEEMFRKGQYFEIQAINGHKTSKDRRIAGILQPRYANGYIHSVRKFGMLETQLLDFPRGKKDLPDALAMAVTMLDPFAAMAADPAFDPTKDVYEPLEDVVGGDWRII